MSGMCYGQRVPNTTTFSFWDVSDVIYGDHNANRNLSQAFTDSNAAYFDANYGSKTMNPKTLYGFRNYGMSFTTVTYLNYGVVTDIIRSIEISNNGQYVYLLYNPATNTSELRKYALSTPYDISTISSTYQSLNLSPLISWYQTTYAPRGLYISEDEHTIYFMYGNRFVYFIELNTPNDLSSWFSVGNLALDVNTFYTPQDLWVSDIRYATHGGNNNYEGSRSYYTYYPYQFVNWTWENDGGATSTGFEFNSDGSKYYIINTYNTAVLLEYETGIIPFVPHDTYGTALEGWDLSSTVSIPADFCFSTNRAFMYVAKNNVIYQFGLPSL